MGVPALDHRVEDLQWMAMLVWNPLVRVHVPALKRSSSGSGVS